MKLLFVKLFFLTLFSTSLYADYMVDFLRVSCIKEMDFLDIEYRPIHNTTIDAHNHKNTYTTWAKHGFFEPSNLTKKCVLPNAEYKIVTSQNNWSNGTCGAAPMIHFSLYRNNEPLIQDVIFGDASCWTYNSITKITIQDIKDHREMEVCFQGSTSKCEWYFENTKEISPFTQKTIDNFFLKEKDSQ